MSPLEGDSTSQTVPGVLGTNTSPLRGDGVFGDSTTGRGVVGRSNSDVAEGVGGFNIKPDVPSGPGVLGQSIQGPGVHGHSTNQPGVVGDSDLSIGVLGTSATNDAVHGNSLSTNAAGVSGFNLSTSAPSGPGVLGHSSFAAGVVGSSDNGAGVVGDSQKFDGVFGVSHDSNRPGVSGHNQGPVQPGLAGLFDGNVQVTGDILLAGADCAEDFDVAALEAVEPGTVMVIGQDSALLRSEEAYDKRVAGVVSGAGDYRHGIVLDRRKPAQNRKSIALLGKVYCRVDAQYSPINIGDLLTTSPTPGHAMKATDPVQAFGAVVGKALRALRDGQGLIPILVALQ